MKHTSRIIPLLLIALPLVAAEPPVLVRDIDVSRHQRLFPNLTGYRNTSIQKAPAPVLAELSEKEFGKAKITRCWLNLDEMWDYRTRKYEYNYQVGVHKYDDIKEKHPESWNWVEPTRIRFDDYLKAFGEHSDEIMLSIRRYERDVLDGKLGLTMEDWKTLFKAAVKHCKEICPNVRYIEVCNENELKGFANCTPEEYYKFYRLGAAAVDEVNREMKLEGNSRILVGGPVNAGFRVKNLEHFFDSIKNDQGQTRLDFVSWHEYHNKYAGLAYREVQLRKMMSDHGLPADLPLFITEHDPYHPPKESREHNLINGAALVKSLYFCNAYSPGIKIMPWVLYHNGSIQTRFMWFEGPNEPDTKAEELVMLPAGCSMKLLSMHRKWEVPVDNNLEADHIVLASVDEGGMAVHAVNYGDVLDVRIEVGKLNSPFAGVPADGKLNFVKYLVDEKHSNAVTDPNYRGGIQQVENGHVIIKDGKAVLAHSGLAKNGILFWMLTPAR